jgi:hypothetical protein
MKNVYLNLGHSMMTAVKLSTAHMLESDSALLQKVETDKGFILENTVGLAWENIDEGHMVWVPDEALTLKGRTGLLADGFSLAFVELMQACSEANIEMVLFATYYDANPGIPTFDW